MRKTIAAAASVALIALAGISTWAWARTGECGWCPTYTCYSACSESCPCIAPPGTSGGGKCYSVSRAEPLVEEGWQRLE